MMIFAKGLFIDECSVGSPNGSFDIALESNL